MAFSSGRSKAKREAKKAQQRAYLNALDQAKAIDQAQPIATNQTRQLKINSSDLDYSSIRLAMQADRLARKANANMGDLNTTIGTYNARLDQYKRQRNGESITKYEVQAPATTQLTGMAAFAGVPTTAKRYATEAEALAEADKLTASAQAQASKANPVFGLENQNSYSGMADYVTGAKRADSTVASVKPVSVGAITGSYRTLPQTKDAYEDLSKLSKQVEQKVSASGLNQLGEQYASIGERLKNNLKRQQTIKAPGLIDQEIYKPGQALPDIIG